MSAKRVVVTRPLPDGERTASALRAKGRDVLLAPLLRIEPFAAELSGNWTAVILTSANAARAIALHRHRAALIGLPVFAVGAQTAAAAREAGFGSILSSGGDAGDLVQLVSTRAKEATQPLLYLAGEERAADVAGALAQANIAVTTRVIYRAVRLPFSAELGTALQAGTVSAVLHYSRRSAESFLAGAKASAIVERALAPPQLCLSAQVAEPLTAAGAKIIAIAAQPEESALFDLL